MYEYRGHCMHPLMLNLFERTVHDQVSFLRANMILIITCVFRAEISTKKNNGYCCLYKTSAANEACGDVST